MHNCPPEAALKWTRDSTSGLSSWGFSSERNSWGQHLKITWMFWTDAALCSVTSIYALIPPTVSLPLLPLASPPCDCSATVPGTILSVSHTNQCTFSSRLLIEPTDKCLSRPNISSKGKRTEGNGFESAFATRTCTKELRWPSQISFQLAFLSFLSPPLPPSQNKWIIRAETFPHVLGLSECRQGGFTETAATANMTASFVHRLHWWEEQHPKSQSKNTVMCSDSEPLCVCARVCVLSENVVTLY